jgi:hypothetical protein
MSRPSRVWVDTHGSNAYPHAYTHRSHHIAYKPSFSQHPRVYAYCSIAYQYGGRHRTIHSQLCTCARRPLPAVYRTYSIACPRAYMRLPSSHNLRYMRCSRQLPVVYRTYSIACSHICNQQICHNPCMDVYLRLPRVYAPCSTAYSRGRSYPWYHNLRRRRSGRSIHRVYAPCSTAYPHVGSYHQSPHIRYSGVNRDRPLFRFHLYPPFGVACETLMYTATDPPYGINCSHSDKKKHVNTHASAFAGVGRQTRQ